MVFPGLMAMHVVRWIVGALEFIQDQHLVRVTREHLQRALACKLGNSLIWFLLLFFSFSTLSTCNGLQRGKSKNLNKYHGR